MLMNLSKFIQLVHWQNWKLSPGTVSKGPTSPSENKDYQLHRERKGGLVEQEKGKLEPVDYSRRLPIMVIKDVGGSLNQGLE